MGNILFLNQLDSDCLDRNGRWTNGDQYERPKHVLALNVAMATGWQSLKKPYFSVQTFLPIYFIFFTAQSYSVTAHHFGCPQGFKVTSMSKVEKMTVIFRISFLHSLSHTITNTGCISSRVLKQNRLLLFLWMLDRCRYLVMLSVGTASQNQDKLLTEK